MVITCKEANLQVKFTLQTRVLLWIYFILILENKAVPHKRNKKSLFFHQQSFQDMDAASDDDVIRSDDEMQ